MVATGGSTVAAIIRIVTGEALRDDPNNGYRGDYAQ